MYPIPRVLSTRMVEECGVCFGERDGVSLEVALDNGNSSRTIKVQYCWKHYRELLKGIAAIRAFERSCRSVLDALNGEERTNEHNAKEPADAQATKPELFAKKIHLIKTIRELTGLSLKEAIAFVEAGLALFKPSNDQAGEDSRTPSTPEKKATTRTTTPATSAGSN